MQKLTMRQKYGTAIAKKVETTVAQTEAITEAVTETTVNQKSIELCICS